MGTLTTLEVTYPINRLVTIFDDVALKTLRAYKDAVTGLPQDMDIGATGDVNVETLNDVNITYSNAINIYDSKHDTNRVLQISTQAPTQTAISSLTNDLHITTGNNLDRAIYVGSTDFTESNNYQALHTTKSNGFIFKSTVSFDNPGIFNNSVTIGGNLLVRNNAFAQSLNVIKAYDPAVHPNNARLTGYTFVINEQDQLELLRYHTFADDSSVTQRVALFGRGSVTSNDLSDYDFLGYQGILENLGSLPPNAGYAPPVPIVYDPAGNALVDSVYLATLSNQLISTRSSLMTLNTRFIGLSNTTNTLASTVNTLALNSSTQSDNLAALTVTLDSFSSSIATTNADLAAHKTWAHNNSNALNYRIATLCNSHLVLQQDVASLQDQFTIVSDGNAAALSTLSNVLPQVQAIADSNVVLTAQITTLNDQMSDVYTNYGTLTNSVNNINSTTNNLTYSVTNLSTGLTALDLRVTNLSNQHFTLLNRFNGLSNSYPGLSNTLVSLSNSTRAISNTLYPLSNHTALLSASHAALNASYIVYSNQVNDTLSRHATYDASLCNQVDALAATLQTLSTSNADVTASLIALSNEHLTVLAAQAAQNLSFQTQLSAHDSAIESLSNTARTNLAILYARTASNATFATDLQTVHTQLASAFDEFLHEEYHPLSNDHTLRLQSIQDVALPNHNQRILLNTASNQTLCNQVDALSNWTFALSNDVIYLYEDVWTLSNSLNTRLSDLVDHTTSTSNIYRSELNLASRSNADLLADLQELASDHDALYAQVQSMSNEAFQALFPAIKSDLTRHDLSNQSTLAHLVSLATDTSNLAADHASLSNSTTALSNAHHEHASATDAAIDSLSLTTSNLRTNLILLSTVSASNFAALSNTTSGLSSFAQTASATLDQHAQILTDHASTLTSHAQSNATIALQFESLSNSHYNLRYRFDALSNSTVALSTSHASLSNDYKGLSNQAIQTALTTSAHTDQLALLTASNASTLYALTSNSASFSQSVAQLIQATDTTSDNLQALSISHSALSVDHASLSNYVNSIVVPDTVALNSLTSTHTTQISQNASDIRGIYQATASLPAVSNLAYSLSNTTSELVTSTAALSNTFISTKSDLESRTTTAEEAIAVLQANLASVPTGNNIAEIQTSLSAVSNYAYDTLTTSLSTLRSTITACNDKYDNTLVPRVTALEGTTASHAAVLDVQTLCNQRYDALSNDASNRFAELESMTAILGTSLDAVTLSNITLSNDVFITLGTLYAGQQALSENDALFANQLTVLSTNQDALVTTVQDIQGVLENGGGAGGNTNTGVVLDSNVIATYMIQNQAVTDAKLDTNFLSDRLASTSAYNLNFKAFVYPPLPLTNYATTLTTAVYGNGTYAVSTSSDNASGPAHALFDASTTSQWNSESVYDIASGDYVRSPPTVTSYVYIYDDQNPVQVQGEYVQLDLPSAVTMHKYSMYTPVGASSSMPSNFMLLGYYNFGSSQQWILLDERTDVRTWSSGTDTEFLMQTPYPVSKLRVVITKMLNNDAIYLTRMSFSRIVPGSLPDTSFNWNGTISMSDTTTPYLKMGINGDSGLPQISALQTMVLPNGDYIDSQFAYIRLAPDSIKTSMLSAQCVDTIALKTDAVTEQKIAPSAITTSKIAENAITLAKMNANSVGTINIVDGSVTRAKMADNSVATQNIVDLSVTGSKIANQTINSNNIIPGQISTGNLADNCITELKMGLNAVGACNILDGAVTLNKIGINVISGEITRYMQSNNVVIGDVTNPQQKLEVAGNIKLSGDIIQTSDARLKENLVPIPNAVDKVMTLTGYTYTFKQDETYRRHAGLIAQEVAYVLPEVVTSSSGQLGISYGNVVALLVQAIKEMKVEINELRSKQS